MKESDWYPCLLDCEFSEDILSYSTLSLQCLVWRRHSVNEELTRISDPQILPFSLSITCPASSEMHSSPPRLHFHFLFISNAFICGWFYIICCCIVNKSCPTLCDSMNCSSPGFPVLHYLPEFAQTHVLLSQCYIILAIAYIICSHFSCVFCSYPSPANENKCKYKWNHTFFVWL